MSVYYCGYVASRNTEKVLKKKDGLSDEYLRYIKSCPTPSLMKILDGHPIKPSRLASSGARWYMLEDNENHLLSFTPDSEALIVLPQKFVSHSIYSEPESDRVLLVVSDSLSCSASQKIVAFHNKFGKTQVLSLDDEDKRIKKLSCGHSFSVLLTEKNELFKIDKCKDDNWKLHHISTQVEVDSVSCGMEHVVVLSRDKKVYTMGRSSRGQLGLGSTENRDALSLVVSLEPLRFSKVVAGGWHCLVLSENGDLYAWGWNESGQVGVTGSSFEERNTDAYDQSGAESNRCEITKADIPKLVFLPALVDTSLDISFRKIHCGSRHSAAITDNGNLFTWGWNGYGQLGHGDQIDRIKPCIVTYFREHEIEVSSVYCGQWSTFVSCKKKTFSAHVPGE